jgi:hypothetical protein
MQHSRKDSSERVISLSQRLPPDNTQHSRQISILPARFKPKISGRERSRNRSSDCAATGDRQLHLHIYKIQLQTALCYGYICDISIKQFSKSNINSIQPHSQLFNEKFWVRTRSIKHRTLIEEVINNQFAVSTPCRVYTYIKQDRLF